MRSGIRRVFHHSAEHVFYFIELLIDLPAVHRMIDYAARYEDINSLEAFVSESFDQLTRNLEEAEKMATAFCKVSTGLLDTPLSFVDLGVDIAGPNYKELAFS